MEDPSSYLRDQAQKLYELTDFRSSMQYMTNAVADTLNLEPVKRLEISGEVLSSILTKQIDKSALYIPQNREVVFLSDENSRDETFGHPNAKTKKIDQIIRISSFYHELVHYRKTQYESNYYNSSLDVLFDRLLLLINPNKDFHHQEIEYFTCAAILSIFNSSFPQEYLGVKRTDEWLLEAMAGLVKWTEISKNAAQLLISYEETGRILDRCKACQYLMPFFLNERMQKWSIPIKEIEFNVNSFYRKDTDPWSIDFPSYAYPNYVEAIAAATNEKEIKKADNQYDLFLSEFRKYSSKERVDSLTNIHESRVVNPNYVSNMEYEKRRQAAYKCAFCKDYSELFALHLNSELRDILHSTHIVWNVSNDERQLYINKRFLKDEYKRIIKIVIGLYELLDKTITPLVYSNNSHRRCFGKKKCPLLDAVTNNKPQILLNEKSLMEICVEFHSTEFEHLVEEQKAQLQSDFKWLLIELRDLGEKTRRILK